VILAQRVRGDGSGFTLVWDEEKNRLKRLAK
jgi:hypothetical protein